MKFTKMEHYVERLKEMYPKVSEKTIKEIIKLGCRNVMDSVVNGRDVLVESRVHSVKFQVYRVNFDPFKTKKKNGGTG